MTLEQKINVLYKLKYGDSAASVGRHFHINEYSVRVIQ
jgi:hypothetical protein